MTVWKSRLGLVLGLYPRRVRGVQDLVRGCLPPLAQCVTEAAAATGTALSV
jgi:hypothetical protein